MALDLAGRVTPNQEAHCPHFGECGGCLLQNVDYTSQIEAKQSVLSELLQRDIKVIASPDPWGYRHRMDYVVAFGKMGLRKRGDGKTVVNLDECHIVQPRISDLLTKIRSWIEELDIRGYNYITHKGDLRYITFRHAISSDQLMIVAVTASEETAIKPLLDRLSDCAESVVWSVQGRTGDDSHGDVQEIHGSQSIIQRVGDKEYEISPNCFFQNNLLLIDSMFNTIKSNMVGNTLDLFCGIGAIGLYVADKASTVVGVDIVEENIRLAEINKDRNKSNNISFVHDNANHFLAFHEDPIPDTVIIDPPRSGMAPRLIRKLNRLGAQRIVYVSCNPKTFLADLEMMEGYSITDSVGFDMFPQTPHVELVSLLERR